MKKKKKKYTGDHSKLIGHNGAFSVESYELQRRSLS